MHNEGAGTRPALGFKDASHGGLVERICAQTIDGFRGERDQFSGAQ
jgi:hypothetical protein